MTRLELQLTKAERLQERGGRVSRRLAPLRAWRPSPAPGLAAAAAVLVAVVLGAVALTRGGDEERVAVRAPTVVERKWLSPTPTSTCTEACDVNDPYLELAYGFGAAWIGGAEHGDVLRIDPATRRVTARIPVGKLPSGIVTTADAVWVLVNPNDSSSSLVRIDPARNRVTDRIPTRRLSIVPAPKLIGDDRAIWLLGADEGVRIDPHTGGVAGRVKWTFGEGIFAKAFGLAGNDLWARAEDGQLLRFDARSGVRTGQATSPGGPANLAVIPGAGVVVANQDGTLTRIDAPNGRARWTTRVANVQRSEQGSGRTERTVAIAGGTIWVLTEPGLRGTERLTAVDLASGRTLSSAALKDVGAGWLKPIGDDLWYIAPAGYAVVVRP